MSSTDSYSGETTRPGRTIRFSKIATYSLLVGGAIIVLYPLFWIIPNSLKTTIELFNNPWSIPQNPQWHNFVAAWTTGRVGRYFLNSVVVCSTSLLLIAAVSTMAAFALKRLVWKARSIVLGLFLLGAMIPIHTVLIPLFIQFTRIGLVNSYLSLIAIYVSYALPVAIFILSGFFGSIPGEIEQAALMDGCSVGRMFISVILPLALPAIVAVVMFNFVIIWNELLVAIVFISDRNWMTLPVGLSNFKSEYATNYSAMFSAILIALVPSAIIYSLFNNRIIEGVTAGAIKG